MKALIVNTLDRFKTLPSHMRSARRYLAIRTEASAIPDAIPFMNPIDGICEAPPPRFMRSTYQILLAMMVSAIVVASLTKIDMVVMAPGTLTTESPPMMLQPIDRGIIRELRVKPGDTVTKGQILAVLDPTFARADLAVLAVQQRSLAAEVHRIEAELNNKPFEVGSAANGDEQMQVTLYRQRMNQYKSRLSYFDQEIQRLNASIRTTEDDRASLAKQLDYAKELENMRGELLRSQNGSKLNYLDAQTLRVRTEREYQDAVNHLTELQHGVQSKQAERETFVDEWRRQLMETLVTMRTEAAKIDEGVAKASLMNDLVMVTAPADGVVLDVAKRSVGSIMREAEPLITIVPSDVPLVADVVISSADVGYTKEGDEVVIKVDAFPYQRHGLLKGRLQFISEESYAMAEAGGQASTALPPQVQKGGAVHRGRVVLESATLENMPNGAHLIPGMTVTAEVKVGARRVISFFLFPLTRGLAESLREP
jgi:HlyD family secretion protein